MEVKEEKNKNGIVSKILGFEQLSICVAFIILFSLLSFITDTFCTTSNILNVLRQASTTMVVSTGMTFVLILGGIDLSVGSIACLAGTLSAGLMINIGIPVVPSLIISILSGLAFGVLNGFLIAKVRIPAFIVTLATMSTARGLALVYSGGKPITGIPDIALELGRGYLGPIPIPVIIMIIAIALASIILKTTTFSRHVFAVGGNEECARLSGIKTVRTKIIVYGISGVTAAITGIMLTMRLASSQSSIGSGLEMDAIASVVLGGTSLSGGKGTIYGTVIGCIFMTILSNGFNILEISSFWQQVFKGIVIIIAVCMYERNK